MDSIKENDDIASQHSQGPIHNDEPYPDTNFNEYAYARQVSSDSFVIPNMSLLRDQVD